MHILVVDPNEAFATLLTEELRRQGYGVDMCGSAEDALQAARSRTPDLALLDMALENPGAVALAGQLRELDANLRLMLIPLMGEELSPAAASISVQGVLPKPFFLPELPERIEAALRAPLGGQPAEGATPKPEPAPASPTLAWEAELSIGEEAARPAVRAAEEEPVGLCYETFVANRAKVERLMSNLAQETSADAVLLTFGGGLLTWVGGLEQAEAESISRAVIYGWRTSAEVARILGREQVRFEQSIAGGDYMLYAVSVEVNAIMAVAIRGSAPLGLLRHRAREAAEKIMQLCSR
jgi:CheY-like chemotaxis protein